MDPHPRSLSRERSALLVIDLQEGYRDKLYEEGRTIARSLRTIDAASGLDLPVLITEQYPKGVGRTRAEVANRLPAGSRLFEKTAFSCYGAEGLPEYLEEIGRDQIVIVGIETHVCVNQTAHDFLAAGFSVHLVRDAITARYALEDETGWRKMIDSGAIPTTSECIVFEWLRDANAPEFRALRDLVK